MTEEMKQKRDELAENFKDKNLNIVWQQPTNIIIHSFQKGFDAAYKLMEAENAELKKEIARLNDKYDFQLLVKRAEKLEAENAELLEVEKVSDSLDKNAQAGLRFFREQNTALKSRIEKLRVALEFYGNELNIEKYYKEVPIPGTKNTRPSLNMKYFNLARAALKADEGEG